MADRYQRDYWPTLNWRVSNPLDQGMDTEILYNMYNSIRLNHDAINSILVIKNGYIVAEGYFHPFHKDLPEHIYCITKPFISSLIGILIDEGKIKDVHQRVLDFFDYGHINNMSDDKRNMTIKDLLTNTTGYEWGDVIHREALSDIEITMKMVLSADWGKYCLDREVLYRPGTFFTSNSNGCQLLASIIRNITGMSPHDFAREKLFKPLGIANTMWVTSSNGENSGAQGLFMTPRDVAKLGLLYLSNGYWEDRSIINEEWIKESTRLQCETRDTHKNDSFIGYGYQWFILSGLPYETYCAYGAYGHFLLVVKDLDLICVTSGSIPLEQHKGVIYSLFKNYVIPSCAGLNGMAGNENYGRFQELLYDIEYPEPESPLHIAANFIRVTNGRKYNFDRTNTFIIFENAFNKLCVKSIAFNFVDRKVCQAEITTYCNHYFVVPIALSHNFIETKFMTVYGEISAFCRGIFEGDSAFKIYYYTNWALKNSLEITIVGENCIECSLSSLLYPEVFKTKRGYIGECRV